MSRLAVPAVRAVARVELRRRWRQLVVLGVLAGVLGGAVVGVAVVARRSSTAYARLEAASAVPDATVAVFGDPALADQVADLPAVLASSESSTFVGQLQGPG